ncbi:MAG: hypothetical protein SGI72_10215 [Planctomycetota bacterium]|nr:hypothetical protein [Planctomycetota bacterium]
MGTVEQCEHFFARFDDEARAIADPTAALYGAFGLERATLSRLLAPNVVAAGLLATLKGNFVGIPVGDIMRMPGTFLVKDDIIRWKFIGEHAGDHPDLDVVAQRASEMRTA